MTQLTMTGLVGVFRALAQPDLADAMRPAPTGGPLVAKPGTPLARRRVLARQPATPLQDPSASAQVYADQARAAFGKQLAAALGAS